MKLTKKFNLRSLIVKKSVIVTWFISYIIVFFVPMLANGLVSSKLYTEYKNQTEEFVSAVMLQKQEDLNSIWMECNKIFQEVFLNQHIERVLMDDGTAPLPQMSAVKIQKALQEIIINEDIITDIQLSLNNYNIVASRNRVLPASDFYSAEKQPLFSDEAIKTGVLKEKYEGILMKTLHGFAYVKTVNSTLTRHNATLIVCINPTWIEKNYRELYNNEGTFMLVNSKDEVIYCSQQTDSQLIEAMMRNSDKKMIKYKGEKYLRYTSEALNVKQLYFVPYNTVTNDLRAISTLICLAYSAALCIGALSIFYFLKQNVNPLRKIIAVLEKNEQLPEQYSNEYTTIESGLEEFRKSNLKLQRKIDSLKPAMVQRFLAKILTVGKIDNEISRELLLQLNKSGFYILLIELTDLGDFYLDNDNEESFYEAQELSFVAITNIFNEILSPLGNIFLENLNDMIVGVINSDEVDYQAVFNLTEKAYQLSAKYLKITARLVLSPRAEAIHELPVLYNNALNDFEYGTIMNEYGLILGKKASNNSISDFSPKEYKDLFVTNILNADIVGAETIVNKILEQGLLSSPKYVSKYALADLLLAAVDALAEQGAELPDASAKCDSVLKVIMDTKRVSEIKKSVHDFIALLCSTSPKASDNNIAIEDSVAKYIKENFSETEMNVTIIADTFQVSTSYLSSRFKQKFGVSILDYINQIRIKNAKELLKKTDLSVEEIFKKSGYISKATFLRQFKKFCSTTPSAYREKTSLQN